MTRFFFDFILCIKNENAKEMIIKHITTLTAGHPFRESIKNALDGDTAVVQMKDVDAEKGLDSDNLYRVNLTGRKNPDYLRQGDILFVGRGYRIFAVLVDEDLEQTVASPHFFILRIKPEKHYVGRIIWSGISTIHRHSDIFHKHVAGTALPHINRRRWKICR